MPLFTSDRIEIAHRVFGNAAVRVMIALNGVFPRNSVKSKMIRISMANATIAQANVKTHDFNGVFV